MKGRVSARLQQSRRPPAWLGDFIIDSDLDQSFTGNQDSSTHIINRIAMAQQQLENPPLEIHNMWHLSDDEARKDKRLPGEGLDISWVAEATKRKVTDRFYTATAGESKCTVANC